MERKSNAQYVKDWVDLRTTNETLFERLIVRLSCLRNVGLGLCQVFWGAGQCEVYAAVNYSNSCVTSEVLFDHLAWHATYRQHVGAGVIRALGDSSCSTHQNCQGQGLACILHGCNAQRALGVTSKLRGIYIHAQLAQVLDGTDLSQNNAWDGVCRVCVIFLSHWAFISRGVS